VMGRFHHLGLGGDAAGHGKIYSGPFHGLNQSPLSPVAKAGDPCPTLNSRQDFFSRWLRIDMSMIGDRISRLGKRNDPWRIRWKERNKAGDPLTERLP
jgi:hypothetical protein